jgi:hypothetical protein
MYRRVFALSDGGRYLFTVRGRELVPYPLTVGSSEPTLDAFTMPNGVLSEVPELATALVSLGSVARFRNADLWDAIGTAIIRQVIRAVQSRKLYRAFCETYGERVELPDGGTCALFPSAETVVSLKSEQFSTIGMAFKCRPLKAAAEALKLFRKLFFDSACLRKTRALLAYCGSAKKTTDVQEGQVLVYRLPGLSIRATEVVVRLAEETFPDWHPRVGRPPALELVAALRLCLCWLRRNMTFQELGDDFEIGTSTAWSYAHGMAEFFAEALGCSAEDLAEQVAGKVCLVDGTLVPTFTWRHRTDLYSGQHREHGMNVQVLVDVHGRLVATSTAYPGSRHDRWCFEQARFAALLAGAEGGIGDAGYQGCELVTPMKKKSGAPR